MNDIIDAPCCGAANHFVAVHDYGGISIVTVHNVGAEAVCYETSIVDKVAVSCSEFEAIDASYVDGTDSTHTNTHVADKVGC